MVWERLFDVHTTVAYLLVLTLQLFHYHPDYVEREVLRVEVNLDTERRVLHLGVVGAGVNRPLSLYEAPWRPEYADEYEVCLQQLRRQRD